MITRDSLGLGTAYEAPAGELEKLIAGAFAEVFELDRVGANDEFFDIGGDSLRGEVLSGLISERTKRDFQISDLIEHTTPRQIARLLGGKSKPAAQTGRPPIFLVHGRLGYTLPKPEFRQAFAEGQELFVFELPGIRGGQSLDRTEDIAAVYVAKLVEHYPQGPILIASFCVGALIALEMASQLARSGQAGYAACPARPEPAGEPARECQTGAQEKGENERAAALEALGERAIAVSPAWDVCALLGAQGFVRRPCAAPRQAPEERAARPRKIAYRVDRRARQASACPVANSAAELRRARWTFSPRRRGIRPSPGGGSCRNCACTMSWKNTAISALPWVRVSCSRSLTRHLPERPHRHVRSLRRRSPRPPRDKGERAGVPTARSCALPSNLEACR